MGNDLFQLVGTCLDGKFQVEKFVAQGGFAVVYSGQHLSLDRTIAIKVLKTPPELNERARQDFISKFRLEAKTIARLSHLNIVQVIDFGVSRMPSGETAPWMVLEWLTGRSLEKELAERRGQGGRSPDEALKLLEPIFDALAYAHEERIAHRDVKPANIMIVPTKRGEMLKLLDFGIVKIMEKGETAEQNLAPTRGVLSAHSPAYAAPEQITGLRTGPWTDVHALALVLTEVMTDSPSYDGKNITTLLREILSPQRPTPARHRIDAGPWEAVLGKALALEPADRFKDAGEFLAALKSAIPAALKPVAVESEPQEAYVITQILPPARPPPESKLPADSPLRSQPARASSAASRPIKVATSSGNRISTPAKWLAAAGGAAVLGIGLVYLAVRTPADHKSRAKPAAASPAEASRPATQDVPGSRDSTPRESTAVAPPEERSLPSSPPSPEPTRTTAEASRGPASTAAAQIKPSEAGPVPPPAPSPVITPPPAGTMSGRASESARRDDGVSSTERDAGVVGSASMKRHTGDQPAASGRRHSENKPLQKTKIELE